MFKLITLLTIIFASSYIFSQSKKEQIIQLQNQLDSIIIIKNDITIKNEKLTELNNSNIQLANKSIQSLNDSLLKKDKQILIIKENLALVEKQNKSLRDSFKLVKTDIEKGMSQIFGKLTIETFYGPPGFGEDPMHDKKINCYILIIEDEPNGDNYKMQISASESLDLDKYLGKYIFVKGELFSSHTGYHNTPILINAVEIQEYK
jgi:uncharacterized protein (DUF488 family)